MVYAPSGGAPKQGLRWDLVDTEGCGGGIRFLAPVLIVRGYVGIYRRKEYVGGASRGPRDRGAPSSLVAACGFLDGGSKSPRSYLMRKSRSRRFHSVWTPFDIPFL